MVLLSNQIQTSFSAWCPEYFWGKTSKVLPLYLNLYWVMGLYVHVYIYINMISYIIYVFFFRICVWDSISEALEPAGNLKNPRHQPVTPVTVALHVKRPSHGGTHPTSGEPSPVEWKLWFFGSMFFSLPKTHLFAHWKKGLPLKKHSLPTINFQMLC